MALRKAQKEMAISLFARVFSTTEDEKSRKELYIQFADAYDGSIKDWREKVEQEIVDEERREQFRQFYNREQKTDIKEFITVEPLRIDDLEKISYLSSKELGTGPWIKEETGPDSIIEFVDGGYSYGGYYTLYIDTFVVNSDSQGLGIGRMLYERLRKDMFRNRIFGIKLMTKRGR